MTFRKRKKNSRQRATQTHGWGAKKKHRGSGNKGGVGMSGSGKRADSKKPSLWKNVLYFGKHGFRKKGIKKDINAINVSVLEEKLESFLSQKLIEEKDGMFIVDLEKLGFNKLLGKGRITRKFEIKTPYASKNAVEAVEAAGGKVILPKKEE